VGDPIQNTHLRGGLLTRLENAWPLTLVGGVAPGSQAIATYLGIDTMTSGNWTGIMDLRTACAGCSFCER